LRHSVDLGTCFHEKLSIKEHACAKITEMYTMLSIIKRNFKLDGCIVWNAHNTVLGEEALLIYIVPVCYVKTGRYGKT